MLHIPVTKQNPNVFDFAIFSGYPMTFSKGALKNESPRQQIYTLMSGTAKLLIKSRNSLQDPTFVSRRDIIYISHNLQFGANKLTELDIISGKELKSVALPSGSIIKVSAFGDGKMILLYYSPDRIEMSGKYTACLCLKNWKSIANFKDVRDIRYSPRQQLFWILDPTGKKLSFENLNGSLSLPITPSLPSTVAMLSLTISRLGVVEAFAEADPFLQTPPSSLNIPVRYMLVALKRLGGKPIRYAAVYNNTDKDVTSFARIPQGLWPGYLDGFNFNADGFEDQGRPARIYYYPKLSKCLVVLNHFAASRHHFATLQLGEYGGIMKPFCPGVFVGMFGSDRQVFLESRVVPDRFKGRSVGFLGIWNSTKRRLAFSTHGIDVQSASVWPGPSLQ